MAAIWTHLEDIANCDLSNMPTGEALEVQCALIARAEDRVLEVCANSKRVQKRLCRHLCDEYKCSSCKLCTKCCTRIIDRNVSFEDQGLRFVNGVFHECNIYEHYLVGVRTVSRKTQHSQFNVFCSALVVMPNNYKFLIAFDTKRSILERNKLRITDKFAHDNQISVFHVPYTVNDLNDAVLTVHTTVIQDMRLGEHHVYYLDMYKMYASVACRAPVVAQRPRRMHMFAEICEPHENLYDSDIESADDRLVDLVGEASKQPTVPFPDWPDGSYNLEKIP